MDDQDQSTTQRFSWKMSPFFHKEIETHLSMLEKKFKKKVSKQKWIEDAVIEKLQKQESNIPHEERICFKIDPLSLLKLEEQLKKIRTHLKDYSKQQLLLEAVQEKLSADEDYVKQKISEQKLLLTALRDKKNEKRSLI